MTAQLQLGLWNRRRVRMVRQTEVAECGLACLAMIANYHGMDVDLATLRRRHPPSLRGATLRSLIDTADQLGFTSRAVKLPLSELPNLRLPAILHWDLNHFVVAETTRTGGALIHNPGGTSRWHAASELSDHFTGVALELSPAEDFEPVTQRERLKLRQLWRRMTGFKRALVQIVVLSLVMQAFVLTAPYYMQIAVDSALPALDASLLTMLALGFGLFTLINLVAQLLRSMVLLSTGTSLGFGVATNIARKLFRLPVSWFEKRHVGDVLSRFQSIAPIRQILTEGAVATLLDGCLAVLILLMMFFYSLALTGIVLLAFLLYAAVRAVSFPYQREAQESAIIAAAKEQSMMIESIRGIVTLRLFNREAGRHGLWQSRLTDSVNSVVRAARIGIWQQVANALIFGIENVAIIWIAIGFVMSGGFSVGMVFAFMAYKLQFIQRATSLVDQLIAFQMLTLHLDRLSDIALADQDVSFSQPPPPTVELQGRLELRDVSFRYSPNDPLVLDRISLVVEAGEHVAITGPSGGGKSTLSKIMIGLLEPDEGEVLVDGVPLARFGHKNFHDQIGAVLQEDHLFAGSLAENIALFDDAPDTEKIHRAAAAASLHDEIATMPMHYETRIGDMGSTLSGGQKQRLLLARALYKQPGLLVLDEATSHLDKGNEGVVNASIAKLGITRIVIAHRTETVCAAKRVYVLRDGVLREEPKRRARTRALHHPPG